MQTQLKAGQSAITGVRLVNKVKGDPSKGYNFQIEVRSQHVDKNILALFLPTDTRINQAKSQPAWRSIEKEVFFEYFGNLLSDKQIEILKNLQPVGTLPKQQWIENTHFVRISILDPQMGGNKLGVQIVETTEKPANAMIQPKKNPMTGQTVTHGGKPVYRITTVEFNPKNILLASDPSTVVQQAPAMVPNPNVTAIS